MQHIDQLRMIDAITMLSGIHRSRYNRSLCANCWCSVKRVRIHMLEG